MSDLAVREPHKLREPAAANALFEETWGSAPGVSPMGAEQRRTLSRASSAPPPVHVPADAVTALSVHERLSVRDGLPVVGSVDSPTLLTSRLPQPDFVRRHTPPGTAEADVRRAGKPCADRDSA
ncbi:hypothetical protein [Streptomyces sp. NRRL S-920]|uniref:hypothetical protein n=1 Tax=Streptomyces sp. NRRL S-920 TaxID=1463921 RepID=UPI00131BC689|nr:hypothetical protein [Streptomyces sp. NRRL S-920]